MNKTLADYCSFQEGYVNPSQKNKSFFGGDIKWLRTLDLTDRYIKDTSQHLTEEGFKSAGKSAVLFPVNSIAINKSGTIIGAVGILNEPMCGNRAIIDIVVNDSDLLMYIYYLLKYKHTEINKKAVGSIQRNLYVSALETIEVTTDDKELQMKIGNVLSSIDDVIDNNNRIIEEISNMIKMLFDYWFLQYEFPNPNGKPYKSDNGEFEWNDIVKKDIPKGWKVKYVDDFCNIFTGKKDVNQALENGEYKFFSCSPEYKYSNDKLYEGKAILISGNGSYTGRTIFVNDSFDLYQRTYACVSKDGSEELEYIYYSMLRFFTQKVGGGTHGSAIPYIVFDDIAKEPILYDEIIVGKFQKIIEPLQDKIISCQKCNEELESIRDFLLPLLMNGQVGFRKG